MPNRPNSFTQNFLVDLSEFEAEFDRRVPHSRQAVYDLHTYRSVAVAALIPVLACAVSVRDFTHGREDDVLEGLRLSLTEALIYSKEHLMSNDKAAVVADYLVRLVKELVPIVLNRCPFLYPGEHQYYDLDINHHRHAPGLGTLQFVLSGTYAEHQHVPSETSLDPTVLSRVTKW